MVVASVWLELPLRLGEQAHELESEVERLLSRESLEGAELHGLQDRSDALQRGFETLQAHLGATCLLSAHQVHSATAVVVEGPWADAARPKVDAIVTATPGVAVGALSADCAPVLFADPVARVVAAAHAGWRGAVSGIVESAIAEMEKKS